MLVVSFNIRYPDPADGEHQWSRRCHRVAALLRGLRPDLMGLQEVTQPQRDYLERALPEFRFFGRGRLVGGEGEQACIAVRRPLEALGQGTFWLSPEPDQPGSEGWDAVLPRTCNWVRLPSLTIYNTHLDHAGTRSRLESARLLLKRIEGPAVLVGDFNETPDQPGVRLLCDSLKDAHAGCGCGTYHGFQGGTEGPRIDYIFLSPGLRLEAGWVVFHQEEAGFPSDHHAVAARLQIS